MMKILILEFYGYIGGGWDKNYSKFIKIFENFSINDKISNNIHIKIIL